MSARDKTRPFTKQFESKPDHEQELAAACERFATVLRTAQVETTKTGARDIRQAPLSGDERPLWTRFESQWHRYIATPGKALTIH